MTKKRQVRIWMDMVGTCPTCGAIPAGQLGQLRSVDGVIYCVHSFNDATGVHRYIKQCHVGLLKQRARATPKATIPLVVPKGPQCVGYTWEGQPCIAGSTLRCTHCGATLCAVHSATHQRGRDGRLEVLA